MFFFETRCILKFILVFSTDIEIYCEFHAFFLQLTLMDYVSPTSVVFGLSGVTPPK